MTPGLCSIREARRAWATRRNPLSLSPAKPILSSSDLLRHHLVKVIGPGRIYYRLHEAVAAFASWEEARVASKRDNTIDS